ncbi:LOW QUALITY PROTEIN: hypothetical protein U9M48_002762 [Paspalum notatum var. saurae]|uniref:Serpin domain-containing protein n=1 Tax=Paspalum notatum var. saurae TaxID=547442 RepID=A0AAQ3PGF6_PASNO
MAAAGVPRFTSAGLSALSHRLMREFTSANKIKACSGPDAGNLVFSLLSIYSALSLAAAGAQGSTLSELLDVLGASSLCLVERAFPDGQQPGGPRVERPVARCGVDAEASLPRGRHLVREGRRTRRRLLQQGQTISTSQQQLLISSLSLSLNRSIDGACSQKKQGRRSTAGWRRQRKGLSTLSSLIKGSVKSDTGVVLATAIYFKGTWKEPFEKHLTKKSKFRHLDGTTVDAEFMRSNDRQFIVAHEGFKVLKMPYAVHDDHPVNARGGGSRREPYYSRDTPCSSSCQTRTMMGFPCWKVVASSPGFLEKHMPKTRVPVGDFLMPKFKLSFDINANRALQDLGIKTSRRSKSARHTNFEAPLFLEDVFHKAVIEVNEEGNEAAACTAMTAMRRTACFERPKRVDFVADHPFAFFVVEETSGAILFAGQVLDPTKT